MVLRRPRRRPSGRTGRGRDPGRAPGSHASWATRWPTAPTWPRSGATRPQARQAGEHAQRIADELDDLALRSTAAIGTAVVRLQGGALDARAELLAVRDAGLRLRIDELATAPMSNLAHLDVDQGRFAEAEDTLADALRVSEERDVPICSQWQRGVQARLRLLQGRWPEAEQDALAVLAAGDLPLGRLWSHLVLGLLAARREAPADEPAPRRAVAVGRPARPARGSPPRSRRRWPSRSGSPAGLTRGWPACSPRAGCELPGPGGERLRRWAWRLAASRGAAAGRRLAAGRARSSSRPSSPTSARSRCTTTARPTRCWARSRCSTGWAREPWPRWCAGGCANAA